LVTGTSLSFTWECTRLKHLVMLEGIWTFLRGGLLKKWLEPGQGVGEIVKLCQRSI
jgi:hypothetical protein